MVLHVRASGDVGSYRHMLCFEGTRNSFSLNFVASMLDNTGTPVIQVSDARLAISHKRRPLPFLHSKFWFGHTVGVIVVVADEH